MEYKKNETPPIDPDPFATAALVLAVISTGASIYSAKHTRGTALRERKDRDAQRKSNMLRYEAELIELKQELMDFETFLQRAAGENQPLFVPETRRNLIEPLQPFSQPNFFNAKDYARYKKFSAALATRTKTLSNLTFELIPDLSDPFTIDYLENSAESVRNALLQVRDAHSLPDNVNQSIKVVEALIKTVEYLREGLLS